MNRRAFIKSGALFAPFAPAIVRAATTQQIAAMIRPAQREQMTSRYNVHQEPFTGDNGTTPTGWTNLGNTIVIQSNQGTGGTAFQACDAIWTGFTSRVDQYAKLTINVMGARVGVYVRNQNNGAKAFDGYLFATDGSGGVGHTYLNRYVSGTSTTLQTFSDTFTIGDVMELRAYGTTLRCYKNGVQIGTDSTDSSWETGYPGIYVNGTVSRVDNWEGGDLGTPDSTVNLYADFEAGSDGDVFTTANIGCHPSPPWGSWALSRDPLLGSRISNLGEYALGHSVIAGGVSYNDAIGTKGYQLDHSVGDEYLKYNFQSYKDIVSIGFFFMTETPYTSSNSRSLVDIASDGTEYVVFNITNAATSYHICYLETISGSSGDGSIHLYNDVWYWIALKYDKSNRLGSLAVFDAATWTQIGGIITGPLIAGVKQARFIAFGQDGGHGNNPSNYSYFDDLIVDYTNGKFPVLP